MHRPLRVLLVEDSDFDEKLVIRELTRGGYDPMTHRVETHGDMLDALKRQEWDVIISDYRLPEFSGPDALGLVKELGLDIPFIIVSGTVGEISAVEAMKAGAHDYVMKHNLTRLTPAIARELNEAAVRRDHRNAEIEREKIRDINEQLLRQVATVALQQRAFLRDVLSAVTEGRLALCDTADDLPTEGLTYGPPIPIKIETMRYVRMQVDEAASALNFSDDRRTNLITAVGEATMNAIVHGGGGVAHIHTSPDCIQVRIEDQGAGIDLRHLPRATLERGYTTRGSLGHGFFLMLSFVDRVYLLTGAGGTTVVMEQNRTPPEPAWLSRADTVLKSVEPGAEFPEFSEPTAARSSPTLPQCPTSFGAGEESISESFMPTDMGSIHATKAGAAPFS